MSKNKILLIDDDESLLEVNLNQDLTINAVFEKIQPFFQLEFPKGGEQVLSKHKIEVEWTSYQVNDEVNIDYSVGEELYHLSLVSDPFEVSQNNTMSFPKQLNMRIKENERRR